MLRIVSQPRVDLLRQLLACSSMAWEAEQQALLLTSGQREYISLMRADHTFTRQALRSYAALCCSDDLAVQAVWEVVEKPTRNLQHLSFKLIARGAALVYMKLFLPEDHHPFYLLRLDSHSDPSGQAHWLLHVAPRCVMDAWTLNMLSRYSTTDMLLGPQARAERQAMLLVTKHCITRVEAKHSSIRRCVKQSSLQSRTSELSLASAMFVLKNAKHDREGEPNSGLHDARSASKAKKRSRKIAPWNCFLHAKLKGQLASGSLQSDFAVISRNAAAEWKHMADNEKLQFRKWSKAANRRRELRLQSFPNSASKDRDDAHVPVVDAMRRSMSLNENLDLADVLPALAPEGDLLLQKKIMRKATLAFSAEARQKKEEGQKARDQLDAESICHEVNPRQISPASCWDLSRT